MKTHILVVTLLISLLLTTRAAGSTKDSIFDAAAKGDIKTVDELLAGGTSVDTTDQEGRTPLMFASGTGQNPLIYALLSIGADIKAQDKVGRTPLM